MGKRCGRVHCVGSLHREDSGCVVVVTLKLGQSRSRFGRVEFALLDRSLFVPLQLLVLFLNRLLNLLADNTFQTSLDLAPTVVGKTAVSLGNVVPQKEEV